jgi:hypothetical protein
MTNVSGHAVDAPVDADLAVAIDDGRGVRIAVFRQPALAGGCSSL